jgi:hypothetical protein
MEWNWNPKQATGGPRYEVLLVLPKDGFGGPYVLREIARCDSSHRWWDTAQTPNMIEVAGQKVVAFRLAAVPDEEQFQAIKAYREASQT